MKIFFLIFSVTTIYIKIIIHNYLHNEYRQLSNGIINRTINNSPHLTKFRIMKVFDVDLLVIQF